MTYDIYINDTIGYPFSARYVQYLLSGLKDKEEVHVCIDSIGGSLKDGLSIRELFAVRGNVVAHIKGMTASAATVLAMGAKRIVMGRYALMLVHNASFWTEEFGQMNAQELTDAIARLQHSAKTLHTMDDLMAAIYADRTGGDFEKMRNLMREERWLTAEEALSLGLVDEIEEDTARPLTAEMTARCLARNLPSPPDLSAVVETEAKGLIEKIKALFTPKTLNVMTEQEFQAQTEALASANQQVADLSARIEKAEAQLQAVEAQLQERTATLEATQKEADELRAQLSALASSDGDETTNPPAENPEAEAIGMASARANFQVLEGLV